MNNLNLNLDENLSSYEDNFNNKKQSATDTMSLIFLALYLLVPFAYSTKYQDYHGLQWFLLSIVNGITSLFLLFNKDNIINNYFSNFLKNKLYLTYIIFTIISGISILNAFNIVESLVQYSRLLNIVIAFTLLGCLFINRRHLFKQVAFIVTLITFVETLFVFQDFYTDKIRTDLSSLILENIKWTTGNKNIFTATLVAKLPFIVYSFINSKKNALKLLSLATVFLSSHIIYLSITRTAFVGLVLVFITLFLGSFIVRKINNKNTTVPVLITIIIAGVACLLAQLKIDRLSTPIVNTEINSSIQNVEKPKAQVLSKLGDSEGDVRFKYWEGAAEIIKENPVLGVGYGNFKLHTPKYSVFLTGDNVFSKHPHNDFVFVAGESGILAVIIYLLVFALGAFITLKNLFIKNSSENKLINLVLLTSLGTCFLDAMFNFPKERPVTQIILIIILVSIIVFNTKIIETEEKTTNKTKALKLLSIITLLISSVIIYTNNVILDSMLAQGIVDTDTYTNVGEGKKFAYNYETVSKLFPSYPNISETYEPNELKLAKYLRSEGKPEEAIKLIQSSKINHPYYFNSDFTIATIYYHDLKNNDSAYVYSLKAMPFKPKSFACFNLLAFLMAEKGEGDKIIEQYKTFLKYNDENEENYVFFCQALYTAKYPNEKLNPYVKEALKKYPNNQEIVKLSAYLDLALLK